VKVESLNRVTTAPGCREVSNVPPAAVASQRIQRATLRKSRTAMRTMEHVSITVVIPTTGRQTLARSLASIHRQTRQPEKILVVFDGADAYRRRSAEADDYLGLDCVESVVVPSFGRPGPLRNVGLALTTSNLVAFLDDDDWWEPSKLYQQINSIIHGGYVAACSNATVHGGASTTAYFVESKSGTLLFRDFTKTNPVITSSMVCSTDILRATAAFGNDPASIGIEDYIAWAKLSLVGEIFFDETELVNYSSPLHSADSHSSGKLGGRDAVSRALMSALEWADQASPTMSTRMQMRAFKRQYLKGESHRSERQVAGG